LDTERGEATGPQLASSPRPHGAGALNGWGTELLEGFGRDEDAAPYADANAQLLDDLVGSAVLDTETRREIGD
jgi:hypothetical protein